MRAARRLARLLERHEPPGGQQGDQPQKDLGRRHGIPERGVAPDDGDAQPPRRSKPFRPAIRPNGRYDHN